MLDPGMSERASKYQSCQCRASFCFGTGGILLVLAGIFLIVCLVIGFHETLSRFLMVFSAVGVITILVGCCMLCRKSPQEQGKPVVEENQEAPLVMGFQPGQGVGIHGPHHITPSCDADLKAAAPEVGQHSTDQPHHRTEQGDESQPHETSALTALPEEPDAPTTYDSIGCAGVTAVPV